MTDATMQLARRMKSLTLNTRLAYAALLIALPFLVYSNNYRHAFQLDDAYTLVTNASIRSLHNVPRYFVDPSTYTSVREQAEYRPILQVTYALNYWMGGYDTWWWHFTQIVLHVLVTLGIYTLCRRLLSMQRSPPPHPEHVAFVAAAIFAVHPAASGVVNYLNARSSLLTAVFLLPALLAYMTPVERADYPRPQWRAAMFYALALFTKVEAVGALGAFWAFDLWQRARESPDVGVVGAVRASFDRRTLRRIAPALVVSAIYFVIRARVMAPFPLSESRHAPDVGAYEYFLTQLTVWWYYVARWLAPVRLVADYLSYPVYRSWHDPAVVLAAAGWIAVAALLVAAWKRAPYLLFLAIACLALLSPTSSIAPLAEMVNEHRPYLPVGILSLGLVIPAAALIRDRTRGAVRAASIASVVLLFVSLSALTYRRNEVFSTAGRYWQDVLAKAPSARAHLNYGVSLMAANDMAGAMQHFHESLDLAPYWYFTHINLGVAYQHLGQMDSARVYYDRGVEYDRYSGLGLSHRGEFRLAIHDYAGARDDFARSATLSLDRYRNTKGLATAYAGLGDVSRSLEETQRLIELDSAGAMRDIPGISQPYFDEPSLRAAGIAFYQALDQRLPGTSWIPENIRRLVNLAAEPGPKGPPRRPVQLASTTGSVAAPNGTESAAMQARLMNEGLAFLRGGDASRAATSFRQIIALNPTHYGAHYQLAVALDRSGNTREARTVWQTVLQMARSYHDAATEQTARTRLRAAPNSP